MGVLKKLTFWKRDDIPEHVEGYTVDDCFTLPESAPIPDTEQGSDSNSNTQTHSAATEPPAEQR